MRIRKLNKKSQVIVHLIIGGLIIAFISFIYLTAIRKPMTDQEYIGENQLAILETAEKAEKALLYVDQAAKIAAEKSINSIAGLGGTYAPEEISSECGVYYDYQMWQSLVDGKVIRCYPEKMDESLNDLMNAELNDLFKVYPSIELRDYTAAYSINTKGNEVFGTASTALLFNIVVEKIKELDLEAEEPAPTAAVVGALTIVIDAGHGGGDSGTVGSGYGCKKPYESNKEEIMKDFACEANKNMYISDVLAEKLTAYIHTVYKTRDGDDFHCTGCADGRSARTEWAASKKADIMVSIHNNAANSARMILLPLDANCEEAGATALCDESKKLAESIADSLLKKTGKKYVIKKQGYRGSTTSPLGVFSTSVLRKAKDSNTKVLLIESAAINDADLNNPEKIGAMADGIIEGIHKYAGVSPVSQQAAQKTQEEGAKPAAAQGEPFIVVDGSCKKNEACKLYLVEGSKYTKYDVAIGLNGMGKTKEDDKKTPVGTYHIKWMASKKDGTIKDGTTWCSGNNLYYGPTGPSNEKLWTDSYGGSEAAVMGLDYPNSDDVSKGYTGGCIEIHASKSKTYGWQSLGCVKMNPAEANEVYQKVKVGTKVILEDKPVDINKYLTGQGTQTAAAASTPASAAPTTVGIPKLDEALKNKLMKVYSSTPKKDYKGSNDPISAEPDLANFNCFASGTTEEQQSECLKKVGEYYYEKYKGYPYMWGGNYPYSYTQAVALKQAGDPFLNLFTIEIMKVRENRPAVGISKDSGKPMEAGFDCSGFTNWLMIHAGHPDFLAGKCENKAVNAKLPEYHRCDSGPQIRIGKIIPEIGEGFVTAATIEKYGKPGDLIYMKGGISHIMFYIGDGYIVHSSGGGVGVNKAKLAAKYSGSKFQVRRYTIPGGVAGMLSGSAAVSAEAGQPATSSDGILDTNKEILTQALYMENVGYNWGGRYGYKFGPTDYKLNWGLDCVGLLYSVGRQLGIISKSSEDKVTFQSCEDIMSKIPGKKISDKEIRDSNFEVLMPGDFVCLKGYGHAGIYFGEKDSQHMFLNAKGVGPSTKTGCSDNCCKPDESYKVTITPMENYLGKGEFAALRVDSELVKNKPYSADIPAETPKSFVCEGTHSTPSFERYGGVIEQKTITDSGEEKREIVRTIGKYSVYPSFTVATSYDFGVYSAIKQQVVGYGDNKGILDMVLDCKNAGNKVEDCVSKAVEQVDERKEMKDSGLKMFNGPCNPEENLWSDFAEGFGDCAADSQDNCYCEIKLEQADQSDLKKSIKITVKKDKGTKISLDGSPLLYSFDKEVEDNMEFEVKDRNSAYYLIKANGKISVTDKAPEASVSKCSFAKNKFKFCVQSGTGDKKIEYKFALEFEDVQIPITPTQDNAPNTPPEDNVAPLMPLQQTEIPQ